MQFKLKNIFENNKILNCETLLKKKLLLVSNELLNNLKEDLFIVIT